MKLTAFFVLVACMHVCARGFSQQVTLSEKNAPLKKVIKGIEDQTGYVFFYEKTLLQRANPVTIDVKNARLEEALRLCFRDQPLIYSIVGTTIVIKPKPPGGATVSSLDSAARSVAAPPIDVHGRIVNENGEPVLASVQVKGSNRGVSTNSEGYFELKGVDGDAVLVISAANIETREVRLDGKGEVGVLRVRMKVAGLNEVVINKGYYTEQQRYSVGNVTKITSQDIEKQPVSNVLLALEGRVTGLNITQNTGLAGGGVTVRLQGQNSISPQNGKDPLIVVDGVQYPSQMLSSTIGNIGNLLGNSGGPGGAGSTLSFLNTDDIESIEVLKDADATAIYGSKAANGAILITTKKGKAGEMSVNVNLESGWGKVPHRLKLLNTQQYLQMRTEAFKNDNLAIPSIATTPTNTDYDVNGLWDQSRYTDWQKLLIGGTAGQTKINATVSGGTANTQYLIGTTLYKETTVFPMDFADKKGSLHFNLNSTSSNQRFKLQLTNDVLFDDNNLPGGDPTTSYIYTAPNAPAIYHSDGSLNWAPNPAGAASWTNPVAQFYNRYRSKSLNLISDLNLGYKILPGLEAKINLGYNRLTTDETAAYPAMAVDPSTISTYPRFGYYANSLISSWLIEPQLNFNRSLGRRGKLDALIGGTIQQTNNEGDQWQGRTYISDQVIGDMKSAGSLTVTNSIENLYKYIAGFGRINYIFNDRFIVNVTARRDGSSRFGPKNRFHNFGAIGGGWIFTGGGFMQRHLSLLSFGKLRASYGTTGNDQIPDYSYMNLYQTYSVGVPYENTPGLNITGLTNPYLEWEETKKIQGGIDLGFFKDQLTLTVNYASNRSANQLIGYVLPLTTGFATITRNFPAVIGNTDWEFSLSSNISVGKLRWHSSFNMTIPKNKLVSFPNIQNSSYSSTLFIGQPLSVVENYHLLGVDPATGLFQFSTAAGGVSNLPANPTDKTVLVNIDPRFYGGFENTFEYHRISLGFMFQFEKQFSNLNDLLGRNAAGRFIAGENNQPTSVMGRWQKPGDLTDIQRFGTTSSTGNISDKGGASNVHDASFVRLKNINLSWSVPRAWLGKANLKDTRLYVQGQNIVTFTKSKRLDPESASGFLPPLRVIAVGLQTGF